jgi:hypothetical protein
VDSQLPPQSDPSPSTNAVEEEFLLQVNSIAQGACSGTPPHTSSHGSWTPSPQP